MWLYKYLSRLREAIQKDIGTAKGKEEKVVLAAWYGLGAAIEFQLTLGLTTYYEGVTNTRIKINSDNERNKDTLIKESDKGQMQVVNFNYFLSLIQNYLVTESTIFDMIKKLTDKFDSGEYSHNTKINLKIFQHFGPK